MSDLGDFGVDVQQASNEEPADEKETETSREYRNGRCPAISVGKRRRCRAPVSRMNQARPFCGTHGRQYDPWTIEDSAEKLILITGRLDAMSLDELDQEDVDFDLDRIRDAVAAVGGEWER